MNYSEEHYERLYTRDTATWRLLGWEGQTVMLHMLRGRFDPWGFFEFGHDLSRAVTAVTGLPAPIVEKGLEALFLEKVWVLSGGKLFWPKYRFAQTCGRSDALRKRTSRENKLASAGHEAGVSQPVTAGHSESQPVTKCHPSASASPPGPPGPPEIFSPLLPSVGGPPAGDLANGKKGAKPKTPKKPLWRRFPPDFEPDESHRKLALELRVDLNRELAAIRDWEFKTPRSDAAATLRTWLRNAPSRSPGAAKADPRSPPISPQAAYEARKRVEETQGLIARLAASRQNNG